MGEIGYNSVDPDGNFSLNDDTDAYGFLVKITPTFLSVISNLDVAVPLTLKFNPHGVSSVQATFTENEDSISLGIDFTYRAVYQLGLVYTTFLGDSDDDRLTDRDFVGLNLKYTF
jgi:hypothetical protein